MTENLVRFIFIGRVSHEKGVHLILHTLDEIVRQGATNFRIDIVGSGDLSDEIVDHPYYGTHLFYHGRLPKENAMELLRQADYTLMPSLFLETFGLVALDSLARGVPVVGEKKGGLYPFIIDSCLEINPNQSLGNVLSQLLVLPSSKKEKLIEQAKKTASDYTPSLRLDRFGQLSNNCKKGLMVSDYIHDIGGIESYILETQSFLRNKKQQRDLFGNPQKPTSRSRKRDLIVSGINLRAALRLSRLLDKTIYDLIWLHSVQRRLGWMSLVILWKKKQQPVWVMYHDFGLFHPFPSHVFRLDQLDRAQTFGGYLSEGKRSLGEKKRWIGGNILVLFKRFYSKRLFFWLQKTADIHLVPSEYLVPYLAHWLASGTTIKVLPHFVSHARDV